MRLKLIFSAIVAIATCAVFAIATHNSQQKLTDAELANIEALSFTEDIGAVLICDYGPRGGRCYEHGYEPKMCKEYWFYQCNFTGRKLDYCSMPNCD